MNRKEFLKYTGLGFLVAGLAPSLVFCSSKDKRKSVKPSLTPSADFNPDLELELTSHPDKQEILPGKPTNIYTYSGRLIKGKTGQVDFMYNSYLGPVIKARRGEKIRIFYKNELPRESIIHWHGLHIPPEMDGHPMYAIGTGKTYVYEFTVNDPAGTYWFHPHPDKITGPQVYSGLAGLFIVEDEEEQRLNLPDGEFDFPIIIQDREFDSENQLIYNPSNRIVRMMGFFGSTLLVNGSNKKTKEVSANAYRLRILNGSNARIYKLAWSDDSPIIIIGTDGGLLEKPVKKPYVMLAPGERVEIWKDFSDYEKGNNILLRSLGFNDGTKMGPGEGMRGGQMGGGMMGTVRSGNSKSFDIMNFKVARNTEKSYSLPSSLRKISDIDPHTAINLNRPRRFYFYNQRMKWVINGKSFEMTDVTENETVKLNTTEIWEFINGEGRSNKGMMAGMMQIPHPVHIHGLQFRILNRDISDVSAEVWDNVKDGFVDEGRQDTFLLMPGMRVQIALKFEDYTGLYIYHCHNLEHEDMGMMRNYLIEK